MLQAVSTTCPAAPFLACSLQLEAALLAQLQRCATWAELRRLLQQLADLGKLAQLADSLLPAASLAAAAAAEDYPALGPPSGKRLRARAAVKYDEEREEEEEGTEEEEGAREERRRQAKRHKPSRQAAVGRCLKVRPTGWAGMRLDWMILGRPSV